MSGFSSFKNSKLLFENWRSHVTEISGPVVDKLASLSPDEVEEMEDILDSDDDKEGSMTLQEDGHTDVASAIRKLKVACENAEDLLEVLSRMPHEGDLPSWWMSKATLASNYLSKMRDYLVYPSEKQLKLPLEEKDDPVSKEISKLVDKGTPHKQAVAIALDMEEKGKI